MGTNVDQKPVFRVATPSGTAEARIGRPHLAVIAAVILLSTGGYFWTYGLFPVWELIWLAPLPILWLSSRVSASTAASAAFACMALARLDMWSYFTLLHIPLWLKLLSVIEPALVLVVAVSLYRAFLRRGQPGRAVLSFPTCLVAAEYLLSFSQGTFGNTAYTQFRNLPVLQLGALAGIWGISFVVALVPAMMAALLSIHGSPRRNMALALASVAVAVLTYGFVRLSNTPPATSMVRVGFVETHVGEDVFPSSSIPIMDLMQRYADQVRRLAAVGAKIVVLPEMTASVNDRVSDLTPEIDALFEQTARSTGTQILLGIKHLTVGAAYNEGRLYSPAGALETVYRKHHLVPGAEVGTTPGTEISILSQPKGTIGVQICRDMDYPELARRYGNRGVGLILVPAWEFGPDYLWHGHMAIMRAVEDGFSMVRSAKLGYLTASDDRGRILAEKLTVPETGFTTMVADVPIRHDTTLFQIWGDWFAWLDLALLTALLVLWALPFLRSSSPIPNLE